MKVIEASVALLLALTLTCAIAQQDPLPEAAAEALAEGRAAMEEALATYEAQYPDRSLWQEAFRHGRLAQTLAPGHPEPLRFLAEAYSRANWYGPAWNAWREYLERGQVLDAEATPLYSEVGQQIGYNYYRQGDLEEAADVYRQIIDEVPFDLEAHSWMGRLLIEMGQPEQAISYWETVVERNPDDQRAEYFLELARDQARWGTEAVNAFREGVAFYEEGDLDRARERFARATSLNREYAEAWAWLGRVAFDNENYADASTYYNRASTLQPRNSTYAYFLEESERRLSATAEGGDREEQGAVEENAGGGAGEAARDEVPDSERRGSGAGSGAGDEDDGASPAGNP